MEVSGSDLEVGCIVMMERPLQTLKEKKGSNKGIAAFKIIVNYY